MQKKWKWIGYVLYGVLLATGLLYYRFPSETIRVYLESTIAGAHPRILLSMRQLRPDFPPGIRLIDAKISLKTEHRKPLLRAENLFIRPEALSFLQGTPGYRFNAQAFNGGIVGYVRFQGYDIRDPFTTSLELKGIHMGRHPYLPPLFGRDVSGTLGGSIVYTGRQDKLIDGAGEGTFTISGGRVQLLQPVLGLESLGFDRLSMKIALKNRKVTLTGVGLEGRAIKGGLSGTITLENNISGSRLDLRGTIEPLGGLFGDMKGDSNALKFLRQGLKNLKRYFVIQGTIQNPEFKFI